MDSKNIESRILDAESSIRNAKCSLELSRDSLRDQEFPDFKNELQNASYELNKASELVLTALDELSLQV